MRDPGGVNVCLSAGLFMNPNVTTKPALPVPDEDAARFASNLGHDFNIALQVIMFNIELTLEHLDPADENVGRLVQIREAAERAAALNRQLLAFARRRNATPSPSAPSRATQYPGGTETILLADDNPTILKISEIMLQRLGYRVLIAHGPVEALRMSQEHGEAIDLLMTDMVMPEMTGKELADTLTAERPGLRVLFMSGFASDITGGSAAANDDKKAFIQKPFTMPALAGALRALLDPAPAH